MYTYVPPHTSTNWRCAMLRVFTIMVFISISFNADWVPTSLKRIEDALNKGLHTLTLYHRYSVHVVYIHYYYNNMAVQMLLTWMQYMCIMSWYLLMCHAHVHLIIPLIIISLAQWITEQWATTIVFIKGDYTLMVPWDAIQAVVIITVYCMWGCMYAIASFTLLWTSKFVMWFTFLRVYQYVNFVTAHPGLSISCCRDYDMPAPMPFLVRKFHPQLAEDQIVVGLSSILAQ